MPKEIYGGSTPTPGSTSPTPSGKVQKLKNVSIQELRKDLEKSRAQQRQKMREGGLGSGSGEQTTVETKGTPKAGETGSKRVPNGTAITTSTTTATAKAVSMSTLPVEQLDISAPLDVSSVGSSVPLPAPDKLAVSFEEPADRPSADVSVSPAPAADGKPKPAGPVKGRGKPKKSVATVRLTELEMAKLGRLGISGGAAGGGPTTKGRGGGRAGSIGTQAAAAGAPGKLSPRPGPSPRPSPRASPRPTPPGSPSSRRAGSRAGGASDQGTDGECDTGAPGAGGKKNVVRVPRKDMPTRREQFQEKQRAAKAAGRGGKTVPGRAPPLEKGETITAAEAVASAEEGAEKRGSSSERSGSRERPPGEAKGSMTREVSKEKGAKSGSRKASLMDGQSPASRAAKKNDDYGFKLVALCRKGDWVGVDTVIKFINKSNVEYDKDAASETTGWTPLMFAVRENRIQIVEQLIDLQFNVNARAKVCVTFSLDTECYFITERIYFTFYCHR